MRAKEFIIEKTLFNPDVSWVSELLQKVDVDESMLDIDLLAQNLTMAFEPKRISFETARGSYGVGVYKAKQSAKVGLAGAEWLGIDADPIMVIYISTAAAKLPSLFPDFDARLKELIKHEYIHHEQGKLSKTGTIGNSPDSEDDYYAEPHEISAIASEIETQLLRIEPDVTKLISMISHSDKRLEKSDRYRLYLQSYRDEPVKFRKAYKRMMKEVIMRLQEHNK